MIVLNYFGGRLMFLLTAARIKELQIYIRAMKSTGQTVLDLYAGPSVCKGLKLSLVLRQASKQEQTHCDSTFATSLTSKPLSFYFMPPLERYVLECVPLLPLSYIAPFGCSQDTRQNVRQDIAPRDRFFRWKCR